MVHRILHTKKYPSDLTDEQWAILAPLIPPAKQSNRGGTAHGEHAEDPEYVVLSQPEWLPMGYAAS